MTLPPKPTLTHRAMGLALNIFGRTISCLPPSLTVPLGAGLGSLAAKVVRSRRDVIMENLGRAFGRGMDPAEHERLYRANYQSLVMNGIDMCYQRYAALDWKESRVTEVEGIDYFERYYKHGKQFITITAHFGNWELLGIWAARLFPVGSLAKPLHNPVLQKDLEIMRGRHGLEIIWSGRNSAARDAMSLIKRGKVLNFLIDQDMRMDGVFVDFFGIPSSTNPSPAMFALKFDLPIIPTFIVRLGPTRHKVIIRPPILPSEAVGETREEKIRDLTQKATREIEDMVRLYPAQYFWFHRRWKTTPERLARRKKKKPEERRRLARTTDLPEDQDPGRKGP